ncbi:hypothetical protein U0070_018683, partial [Myodes glareolus]
PNITKSLLPKGWRVSSPESDSGVALLTPVASHGAFSSHHVTESQEELRLPERDTLSSLSGDTSPSSPSKSDHDTEDASCHRQATKKTLHEKDGANCPKSLRASSSFMVQGGKIKQKFVDLGASLRWNPNKGKKCKEKEASRFSAGSSTIDHIQEENNEARRAEVEQSRNGRKFHLEDDTAPPLLFLQ